MALPRSLFGNTNVNTHRKNVVDVGINAIYDMRASRYKLSWSI